MKQRLSIFLLILALLIGLTPPAAWCADGSYREGEVLVKFRADAGEERVRGIADKHLLRTIKHLSRIKVHHLKTPAGADLFRLIDRLRDEPYVEYAEPNYIRKKLSVTPNDPAFPEQWGMAKVAMESAWGLSRGSGEVIVAVLDTGVDYTHPDLMANMWKNTGEIPDNGIDDDGNGKIDDYHGWNFAQQFSYPDYCTNPEKPCNDPRDTDGHGTHVSGVIGAVGMNGIGVAGINWSVRIMPLKFLDPSGGTVAEEVAAIEYALAFGARVLNASYGDWQYSQTEYDAIQAAGTEGMLVIAAAGNNGRNLDGSGLKTYPAYYNLANIIAVAATKSDDSLASFSNYGATSVDLGAPGVDILSTIPVDKSDTPGAKVTVPSLSKTYSAYGIEFAGQTGSEGTTGILYNCGYGESPVDFPPGVSGNVALIRRGSSVGTAITFQEKVINAQDAGAIAAIIYNNQSGLYEGTLDTPGTWIPAVSVSEQTGLSLINAGTPTVTVVNYPYNGSDYSGTSMATPFVTGTVAILLSVKPDATYQELKNVVLATVDYVPALSGKVVSGGRLNVYRALLEIRRTLPQVQISQGWNFISFPRLPVDPTVETVLSPTGVTRTRVIWAFGALTQRWARWMPEDGHANTITVFEFGKGYWIYADEAFSIDMSGWSQPPSASVLLQNGWNLTGYLGTDGADAASRLQGLTGYWLALWNWSAGTWSLKDDPGTIPPPPVQLLNSMAKTKAYWIRIHGAGSGGMNWEQ
jgi:subtilisin family serine protease